MAELLLDFLYAFELYLKAVRISQLDSECAFLGSCLQAGQPQVFGVGVRWTVPAVKVCHRSSAGFNDLPMVSCAAVEFGLASEYQDSVFILQQ